MIYSFGTAGANNPVIREFDVQPDAKITDGIAVYIDEQGIVNADKEGTLLGVSAEYHSGEKDLLNSRSCGNKIRVDITRGGVYKVKLPVICATVDSQGSVVFEDDGSVSAQSKGMLVLIEKADGSNAKQIRNITNVSVDNSVVTVGIDGEDAVSEGDRFMYVPSSGFEGSVTADGSTFCSKAGENAPVMLVVSSNADTGTADALMCNKLFDR